jgi:hydrogenase maturation factor HypF (carbamoyltransferase family)
MLFCPTIIHSPKLLLDDPTHLTVVKLNHESFMITSEIISGNEIFSKKETVTLSLRGALSYLMNYDRKVLKG